jgi:hypothetical protein
MFRKPTRLRAIASLEPDRHAGWSIAGGCANACGYARVSTKQRISPPGAAAVTEPRSSCPSTGSKYMPNATPAIGREFGLSVASKPSTCWARGRYRRNVPPASGPFIGAAARSGPMGKSTRLALGQGPARRRRRAGDHARSALPQHADSRPRRGRRRSSPRHTSLRSAGGQCRVGVARFCRRRVDHFIIFRHPELVAQLVLEASGARLDVPDGHSRDAQLRKPSVLRASARRRPPSYKAFTGTLHVSLALRQRS